LSVPVQGINNFATGRQPKPSSNGPVDRQEPSPKGPAEGTDGKRTHADIAEATRRKDEEEKGKKRAAVEHAKTIETIRKKKPSGPAAKGKKKQPGAVVTLEKNRHRDKEPVNDVSESEDEDFDVKQWKFVEHRSVNGKPTFRVNYGKRKDGGQKHMWGSYLQMEKDEVGGLDDYIRTECPDIAMYRNLLRPKKRGRPEKRTPPGKTKRAPCNHGMHQDQITCRGEQNAACCGPGYYLHGLKCAGLECRAAFLARNADQQDGKKGVVPTAAAPIYCCINIVGRDGSPCEKGLQCKHAVCFVCWNNGVLATAGDAPRSSRRSVR
jgi:hypothetical protein